MESLYCCYWVRFPLLAILTASTLLAQSTPQPDTSSLAQSFQFSAIRIPLWVNHKGRPVTNLTSKDVLLTVDGKRAKLEQFMQTEDRPMAMVYLLDLSGSMAIGGKLRGSIKAVEYFLSRHQPEDEWQLCVFADCQVVKVLDHTQSDQWEALVPKLRAYGKTALYDALSLANGFFSAQSLANRSVLLFTDGHDNQSLLSQNEVVSVLKKLDVPIFIVAIADGFIPEAGSQEEPLAVETLRHIGETTGGQLFVARDANQLPYISRKLALKMRPQYLLTITVERGQMDRRHHIDIRLKKKKSYQLRFRKGYTGSLPELLGGE